MVSKRLALSREGTLQFLFATGPGHPDDGPSHDFQIWLPGDGGQLEFDRPGASKCSMAGSTPA
jgi:hypothetical protein